MHREPLSAEWRGSELVKHACRDSGGFASGRPVWDQREVGRFFKTDIVRERGDFSADVRTDGGITFNGGGGKIKRRLSLGADDGPRPLHLHFGTAVLRRSGNGFHDPMAAQLDFFTVNAALYSFSPLRSRISVRFSCHRSSGGNIPVMRRRGGVHTGLN